jgi:23S rRNA (uracil1939-C5)-methyltransferase
MREGDIVTIEPSELVAGGDALARLDGFPIFSSNLFPGDVARVRLYEVKKGFARGDVVEIVTPSPWRRTSPCPIANECGGCNWTALRLDRQLEAKRRILSESLRRIGKLDPSSMPPIRIHSSPLNYRLRSRLHREGATVGFYAVGSNRVVQLAEECEVVGVETARALGVPNGENAARRPPRMLPLAPITEEPGESLPEIWELGDELIPDDDRELTLTVDAFTYRLSTSAFFQVNRHLLATMLRLVTAHAARVKNRQVAVDLYGGVGFFTVPVAKLFERVTMIEGSPVSVRYARVNVPPNVRVVAAPVEKKTQILRDADFVFLDPPRAGTTRDVISAIAAETKEMVAYLSCDPVTFARDASRLIASGWRLATLDLLDLFPNTHHVETLSSFERAQ